MYSSPLTCGPDRPDLGEILELLDAVRQRDNPAVCWKAGAPNSRRGKALAMGFYLPLDFPERLRFAESAVSRVSVRLAPSPDQRQVRQCTDNTE